MKQKILVVDDEESIRYTFSRFLENEGHEVATAASFDEAEKAISSAPFDLVFADVLLGDKTGIDFLRLCRRRDIDCPFIIITGAPALDSATKAVRLGAFDYIAKPIDKERLLNATRIALRHSALQREKDEYKANLEAIFQSVRDGIISVDRQMNIVELNGSTCRICGLGRESIGLTFGHDIADCRLACMDALWKTLQDGTPNSMSRIECFNDGTGADRQQVVNVTVTPLMLKGGEAHSGAVMVINDETHVADLEANLGKRGKYHNIIGASQQMQRVYSLIDNLADIETIVLITGESGTGKELVAEALHQKGDRSSRPLIKVNFSALSEGLIESELFGHVKGSFTGAIKDKPGKFEAAHTGTLFIDEIGDLSPHVQVKLLRVLQEREFERVGDTKPRKVDVRLIAATNRNLKEKVARGEFREDLYFRLKVVEINLPPLRQRREDIPILSTHFVDKFSRKFGKDITGISDDALRTLMATEWPGNIRELEHVIEYACIMSKGGIITISDLPDEVTSESAAMSPRQADDGSATPSELDYETICEAIRNCGGKKARAARALGISRSTLYRRIEELGIKE